MKRFLWALFGVAALTGLDQWTKQLAVAHLQGQPNIPIWDGVFELQFLTNRGAAFGIFQNQRWIFLVTTVLIMAALLCFFIKLPKEKRYLPLAVICVALEAGALGNMIDRVRLGYVVDFLYFKLIDFPIFNVADCYVTVGTILAAILLLFYYKEADWERITGKAKKAQPIETAKAGSDEKEENVK